MIKLLLVLGTAAIAAPAIASDVRTIDFVHDGEHYVGFVSQDARGRHIEGRDVTTGKNFSLVVANGRVTGTFDSAGVDFIAATESTETASR